MAFKEFKIATQKQFNKMIESKDTELFFTNINKDEMWETYLESFPDGTNPIFRERREYDCQCCRQFIRAFGNVITIKNNKLVSIWDLKTKDIDDYYKVVTKAMAKYVKSKAIKNVFRYESKKVGTDYNHQTTESDDILKWEHFYIELPKRFVKPYDSIGSVQSDFKSSKDVFKRGLEEITIDAIETVRELICQGSIYRGEEFKPVIESFRECKIKFDDVKKSEQDNFCWFTAVKNKGLARTRNSAIGTLLVDVSEGKGLDDAVKMFESKVAPENYKRSSAVVTKSMIQNAQKKIEELGIKDSLSRRYATIDDITINNILFADRTAKKQMDIFDELIGEAPEKAKNLNKVEEVTIDNFIKDILPKADTIEMMVENKHSNNFMSLIAPTVSDSKNILKWHNNFSWSYNGEVTDSMRERVKSAGGRVDGVLRFTHSWNHRGGNNSLMDLHVFMPTSDYNHEIMKEKKRHNSYPKGQRVGWNNRSDIESGGVQDVDYVKEAPKSYIPIENITFPNINKMPDGDYYLKIHNWEKRSRNTEGFKAEIEINNTIYQYNYDKPLLHHEWVNVAKVTLKNGVFSIEHFLPESNESKNIWNVNTNKFQNVSVVMNSPNHWDGNETGNKHYFFILENCKNENESRGLYNEFLKNDLMEHRKVFEVLGSKLKVAKSDNQLSGLGFSSTKRDSIVCRVKGSFSRTIKINF